MRFIGIHCRTKPFNSTAAVIIIDIYIYLHIMDKKIQNGVFCETVEVTIFFAFFEKLVHFEIFYFQGKALLT